VQKEEDSPRPESLVVFLEEGDDVAVNLDCHEEDLLIEVEG
jgi:hypothetical protein